MVNRLFFMDPIDPEKRTGEDWREAIEIFGRFSSHYRPVLSINRKEATEAAKAYGIKFSVPLNEVSLRELTEAIADAMGLWGVVVHPVDGAGAVIDGEYYSAPGPYTNKPVLTGGGQFQWRVLSSLLLGSRRSGLSLWGSYIRHYVRLGQPFTAAADWFLTCWEEM